MSFRNDLWFRNKPARGPFLARCFCSGFFLPRVLKHWKAHVSTHCTGCSSVALTLSALPGTPGLKADLETHHSVTTVGTPTPDAWGSANSQSILHRILVYFTVINELNTNLLKS